MRPLLLLVWLGVAPAHAELRWFGDEGRAFAVPRAAQRDGQVRTGWLFDFERDESYLDLDLGGDLGLLHAEVAGGLLSATVRALVSTRFQLFSESFDQQNVDYIGGLALGWARGEDAVELWFYHHSAHLGDDLTDDRSVFQYSLEALRLLYARSFPELGLRAVTGVDFRVRAKPRELRWTAAPRADLEGAWGRLQAAGELLLRPVHDYKPDVVLQLGWILSPPEARAYQRVFVQGFRGHSRMGQLYERGEISVFVGLGAEL